MNLNHAMFSFAFAASALVVSLARRAGLPPEAVFPVLALVLIWLSLAMNENERWHDAPEAPAGAGHDGLWAKGLWDDARAFFERVEAQPSR